MSFVLHVINALWNTSSVVPMCVIMPIIYSECDFICHKKCESRIFMKCSSKIESEALLQQDRANEAFDESVEMLDKVNKIIFLSLFQS